MINNRFLDKLAHLIIEDYSTSLIDTIIILPNKRAKIFFIEALKLQTSETLIVPEIFSIEEFIQDISGIRTIDSIELLFEFYSVYQSITDKKHQQSFEVFANWAKTLLQDFNEIDRYLIDPDYILSYLKDIEDIKKWGVSVENKTPLLEKYIDFWKLLPTYYHSFYKHLLDKKIGYQGLIYREADKNIEEFSKKIESKKIIFAGFNALNAAEEKIIQYLLTKENTRILWDIDKTFLDDIYHDAGLFARKYKSTWKHYKSNPMEWIADDFAQPKNISVIGTPKTIGQAKVVGKIIEEINTNSISLDKVALVLGEENLLLPALYALPNSVDALNITMGFPSKNNPVQLLITKLFKMHTAAFKRSNYVFYYKEILSVLTHPLLEPYLSANQTSKHIKKYNYSFITQEKVVELNPNANRLFKLVFNKWDKNCLSILENITEILEIIKQNIGNKTEEDKLTLAFVYSIYKIINKIITYISKNNPIENPETLFEIYKQLIDLAEVSFEGEPLKGLQIMGVLESRVLDFETVIITSMNEGKFPAGKSQNSFIPYDLKNELELPTFKEKDAIYTYHFYHLMQRAKNVYLLYNTESEGLDAGEKSRFITQLEIEKQQNHTLSHEIYNAIIPDVAHRNIEIQKSDLLFERLKKIAEDGFSPSSLTSYIRNPIDFYFKKILQINDVEEVEENIALKTLGTIIHKTLEVLYTPFINRFITENDIKNCFNQLDEKLLEQFKEIYKEGEIKKGRNLLAFEVAKRNISIFLKQELTTIESGSAIKIIALEETLEKIINHPKLPFPIKIRGNVDRIEERDGVLRIIDYKTGKVDKNSLVLKTWENLTDDIKNDKIIQILAYSFLFENNENKPLEAGIISFKNLKAGFMPFNFKIDKNGETLINADVIESFIEEIVILLNEIFDVEKKFEEKI